jgi:hypothetical protein
MNKTLLLTLFGIYLAVLLLYFGTKQVTGNLDSLIHDKTDYTQKSNNDLLRLRDEYNLSTEEFHREALVDQMCQIRSKMAGASAEIEKFLHSRCN